MLAAGRAESTTSPLDSEIAGDGGEVTRLSFGVCCVLKENDPGFCLGHSLLILEEQSARI